MDLIFTNSARVDQGVLQDYELDLAFGADENNLECKVQAGSHCCESGSLLYMEGTEYGGIIDSIESDTDSKEVIYTGRTWHGILNSKVIQPDSGAAYLVLTGEANAVIADLLSRLALTDLFEASSEDSGLNISNYKMNRYISGYDGILKMLKTVGGKLKLTFSGGKVVLSAAAVHDYTQDEEFDADQVPFRAKRNYKGVNHLICLGSGQLEERMVVHLYADTEGNISQEQTQFGLDEVCTIFEYSNIETEEELIQEGKEEFESLMAEDEISIDFDADSDIFDVGDIIGAVDNITGLSAYTTIAKKIVTIKNGKITVSLTPDTAKAGTSYEGSGNSGGESADAYTKAETLSSEVKTMLGLEEDATPADAFKALKITMFCPQIVVSCKTGSTVTCRKGDTILYAEEADGKWTFNVTEYGEWTVTASLGQASNSATVQVYAVCQIPVGVTLEYATIFITGLDENSTVTATKDGKTVNGKWLSAEESGRFTEGHPECIRSDANYLLYTYNTRNYKKAYAGDVYACTVVVGGWLSSLMVSKTANAVSVYTDGDHSSGVMDYEFTVTFRGETWYVSGSGAAFQATAPTTSNVIHFGTFDTRDGAALAFLEYATPQPIGGFEIAPITDYGTWTVTATNGEDTATQDVLVDADVVYTIGMRYKLWLYRSGDECSDVTGGWVAQGLGLQTEYNVPQAPILTKNAANMMLSRTSTAAYACGIILPKNRIDFTGYKTINITVDFAGIASNDNCLFDGYFIKDKLGSVCYDGTRWFRLSNAVSAETNKTITGDISSCDGLFIPYISIYSRGSLTIHKVWLE